MRVLRRRGQDPVRHLRPPGPAAHPPAVPGRGQGAALVDMDGSVLLPVVAAGVYRSELAQTVLSFKRRGQRQLAAELAKALAGAIGAAVDPVDGVLLVPVPTSGAAF